MKNFTYTISLVISSLWITLLVLTIMKIELGDLILNLILLASVIGILMMVIYELMTRKNIIKNENGLTDEDMIYSRGEGASLRR